MFSDLETWSLSNFAKVASFTEALRSVPTPEAGILWACLHAFFSVDHAVVLTNRFSFVTLGRARPCVGSKLRPSMSPEASWRGARDHEHSSEAARQLTDTESVSTVVSSWLSIKYQVTASGILGGVQNFSANSLHSVSVSLSLCLSVSLSLCLSLSLSLSLSLPLFLQLCRDEMLMETLSTALQAASSSQGDRPINLSSPSLRRLGFVAARMISLQIMDACTA